MKEGVSRSLTLIRDQSWQCSTITRSGYIYPVGYVSPSGDDFYQMYPVWDTFFHLDIQIKKGKNCEKRGSYQL